MTAPAPPTKLPSRKIKAREVLEQLAAVGRRKRRMRLAL